MDSATLVSTYSLIDLIDCMWRPAQFRATYRVTFAPVKTRLCQPLHFWHKMAPAISILFNTSLARIFTDRFMTKAKLHAYSQRKKKKKFLMWNDKRTFAFNVNQKVCKDLQKLHFPFSWAVSVWSDLSDPKCCSRRVSVFHCSYKPRTRPICSKISQN